MILMMRCDHQLNLMHEYVHVNDFGFVRYTFYSVALAVIFIFFLWNMLQDAANETRTIRPKSTVVLFTSVYGVRTRFSTNINTASILIIAIFPGRTEMHTLTQN